MMKQRTSHNDRTQQVGGQEPLYERPQVLQRRHKLSTTTIVLIMVLLLLIGGSGFIYYAAVLRPNQQKAQATATALANVTGTSLAIAAQTSLAHAKTTATALTQANVTATARGLATAQAQATVAVLQNVYTRATSGTPVVNDPMTQQDLNAWEVDNKSGGGGCAFKDGSYHASMPQAGFFASCYAQRSNFSNFAFQVEMTILTGDRGGIIFRSDGSNKFYLFRIDQDGNYDLFLYVDGTGPNSQNLLESSSTAIHTGLDQMNKMTVIARDNNLYLYVNQQYLASINDRTYSSGAIAVFAEDHTNSTDVAFRNAEVWKIK